MPRALILALTAFCVFAVVAALMLKFMPGPMKDSDFLVIGSAATLVALLVLFFLLLSTSMKGADVFYKKRKK